MKVHWLIIESDPAPYYFHITYIRRPHLVTSRWIDTSVSYRAQYQVVFALHSSQDKADLLDF